MFQKAFFRHTSNNTALIEVPKIKNFLYFIYDIIIITVGSCLFALGLVGFIEPAEISPGGFTGIAVIINYLTGFPTGTLLFFLNLPLLILGFIKLGGSMVVKTFISTLVSSLAIDIMEVYIPRLSQDKIICSLAGGVLIGVGMAMIFSRGATSGGTDIGAKLIQLKYPYFTLGRLILLMDAVIIGTSAIVFGSLEASLYSVLAIIVQTQLLDKILYGNEGGKVAFVITNNPDILIKAIFKEVQRGVTRMPISGGYSGETRTMLLCALRRQQLGAFRRAVKTADDKAFVVLADAGEIIGNGFKV